MWTRKTLSFSRKIIGNRVQKQREEACLCAQLQHLVPDGLGGLWGHHTVFLAVRTRTIEPTPPTARACGHTKTHITGRHQVKCAEERETLLRNLLTMKQSEKMTQTFQINQKTIPPSKESFRLFVRKISYEAKIWAAWAWLQSPDLSPRWH